MTQSGIGKIHLHDDFRSGARALNAATDVTPLNIGNGTYTFVGQGPEVNDSGAELGANGVTLTATNELEHAAGLTTRIGFTAGTQGTIVAEARVRFPDDLVTRDAFFGFSDVQTDLAIIQGAILKGTTGTLTLTASDICGFYSSSEETLATQWFGVHNGGSATGVTVSANVALGTAGGATIIADSFQILRIEMDNNGDARWYINGILKQSTTGAVSTTTALCCTLIVEEKVTGNAQMLVDYMTVKASRDWSVT